MNSFSASTDPDIESELIDLDAVSFTTLRDMDNDILRRSVRHVVDRTRRVRVRYRSTTSSGGGERID